MSSAHACRVVSVKCHQEKTEKEQVKWSQIDLRYTRFHKNPFTSQPLSLIPQSLVLATHTTDWIQFNFLTRYHGNDRSFSGVVCLKRIMRYSGMFFSWKYDLRIRAWGHHIPLWRKTCNSRLVRDRNPLESKANYYEEKNLQNPDNHPMNQHM